MEVKTMRPILYGIIVFFLGGILWVLFSFVAAAEQLTGQIGVGTALMYVFGIVFLFSLPIAIIAEIYQYVARRKSKIINSSAMSGLVKNCPVCHKIVPSDNNFCPYCATDLRA